jgi:hypothetical protein
MEENVSEKRERIQPISVFIKQQSDEIQRKKQMNRNLELWKRSREVNKEINDIMHIMDEYPRKTKANRVLAQMEEHSRKAKANRNATNAFTPSNAYYIMGHGDITHETFIVPENCIVVVKVEEGESFYQTDKYFPIIYNMNLSILTDPIKKRAELVKALGTVAIYHPGATCPNFRYSVIDTVKAGEQPVLSEFGSGVTNISLYKRDQHKCTLTGSVMNNTLSTFTGIKSRKNSEEIKKFIVDAYQYSIYPTQQDVETIIDTLIDNNITDINDIINKMNHYSLFRPTQEDLCKKSRGVFFNFVCRPNDSLKPIFKPTFYVNNVTSKLVNNVQGLITLQNSPAPFHSANNIRSYSETAKRKLKDAEANLKAAKKEYINTAYGNDESPEREIWSKALNKRLEANNKVKSLKNNIMRKYTIRKSLQSRLGESHIFRRPGIRNMIESTTTNAKRLQKYRNELEKVSSEREKNELLLRLKTQLESNALQRIKNTNDLSKIQNRIRNITQKIDKNGEENKNHLFREKNQLEKEYEKIKGFMNSNADHAKMRSNKVRSIEQKYDTWIQFLEREIAALTRAQASSSHGGRIRSRHTRKR